MTRVQLHINLSDRFNPKEGYIGCGAVAAVRIS